MEIEVFPTTEALIVRTTSAGILLCQHDDGRGHDIQVFIPLSQVENTCRAIRAAAKASKDAQGEP